MDNIIFYMSLSGSIAFILYWIFKRIWRKSISATFRYRLLKLTMCFFLLPIPWFSSYIRDLIHAIIPAYSVYRQPSNVWVYDVSDTIYNTPEGYVFPGYSLWIILLFAASIIITLTITLVRTQNLRKMRQIEAWLSDAPESLHAMADKIQQELRIHRKVTLYCLDSSCSPFCYGFFKPKIIISGHYKPEEYEILLRHELWHIKSCDYMIRLLAFFITALHFFNPLTYLLFHEIDKVSELACDEHVISGSPIEKRIQYGNLLINIAPAPIKGYSNSFGSNSKKTIQERILMIKNPRKMSYVIFACCALFTICCGVSSVAAYQPVQTAWRDNADHVRGMDKQMFVPSDSPDQPELFSDPNEAYFNTHDSFFVQENGDICFDPNPSGAAARSACRHSYQSGNTYSHKKDGKGGCTYSIYSVERCSKCGNQRNQKLINSVTYAVCPHK